MYTGKKLGDAIAEAIALKRVSKAKVADHFGVTPPSISSWTKTGRIGKERIEELITYFSDVVPPSHFGIGITRPLLTIEQTVVDSNLPSGQSVAILEDTDYTDTHKEIEMFDLNLSAGEGNSVWVVKKNDDPLVFRNNWFSAKRLHPDNCKALRVRGNSMKPVLKDWDTVIIDVTDTELVDGEVYAVIFKGKSYIKAVKNIEDGIELISYNQDYEPIKVTNVDADKFQVLGHMVWRGG